MNKYSMSFMCECPKNKKPIIYFLEIETKSIIMVEDLMEFCDNIQSGYHENIADEISGKFGGNQTMIANHHGVTIKTERT